MEEKYNTTASETTNNSQAGNNAANPTPPQPQKVRRVGTLALGVTLIAGGVLLIINNLVPGFDLGKILCFTPVILIVLGIEVLLYAVRPDVKIKYDFASMFICFAVVIIVGCGYAFSVLLEYPQSYRSRMSLQQDMTEQATAAVASMQDVRGNVRDVSVNIYNDSIGLLGYGTDDSTTGEMYVTMKSGIYTDKAAFAADCRKIIDACNSSGVDFDDYHFDTWMQDVTDGGESYDLYIGSEWLKQSDAANLAENVNVEYWYDGMAFSSEAEREEYMKEAATATAETAMGSAA